VQSQWGVFRVRRVELTRQGHNFNYAAGVVGLFDLGRRPHPYGVGRRSRKHSSTLLMHSIEAVFWCSISKAVIGHTPMAALPFAAGLSPPRLQAANGPASRGREMGPPTAGAIRRSRRRQKITGHGQGGFKLEAESARSLILLKAARGDGSMNRLVRAELPTRKLRR